MRSQRKCGVAKLYLSNTRFRDSGHATVMFADGSTLVCIFAVSCFLIYQSIISNNVFYAGPSSPNLNRRVSGAMGAGPSDLQSPPSSATRTGAPQTPTFSTHQASGDGAVLEPILSHSDSDGEFTGSTAPQRFEPLHLSYTWTDPLTMHEIFTVAINMPEGIEKGSTKVIVAEDGSYVDFIVTWPPVFSNSMLAHTKWLRTDSECKLSSDHPRRIGYEKALKARRSSMGHRIKSFARFPSPFPVQKKPFGLHRTRIPYNNSNVRMLFIDLEEKDKDYCNEENDDFEDA